MNQYLYQEIVSREPGFRSRDSVIERYLTNLTASRSMLIALTGHSGMNREGAKTPDVRN